MPCIIRRFDLETKLCQLRMRVSRKSRTEVGNEDRMRDIVALRQCEPNLIRFRVRESRPTASLIGATIDRQTRCQSVRNVRHELKIQSYRQLDFELPTKT